MEAARSQNWIRNPAFDLILVTGGAFFTLMIAAISFQTPVILPIFFWIWIIAFEGSHFWATFTRTYFDRVFRQSHKGLLVGSLVFFLFPFLAVLAEQASSNIAYKSVYGLFIFTWSLYHNARQHFGFTSIYCHKAGIEQELKTSVVRALYLSIVPAQIYFFLNFKVTGVFSLRSLAQGNSTLLWILSDLPKLISVAALVYAVKVAFQLFKERGKKSFPTINYILTCLVFYPGMFYFIAPIDLFIQDGSGAQKLMLIAIMNSLFHNIQYHAIVWHYGQERYSRDQNSTYGMAKVFGSKTTGYLFFSLVLGSLFAGIVWFVGDWPNYAGSWANSHAFNWAYVLFFGIIGHHFFLDQKIWRPSKQKDLKSYLS